jgi:hypothetical protein
MFGEIRSCVADFHELSVLGELLGYCQGWKVTYAGSVIYYDGGPWIH